MSHDDLPYLASLRSVLVNLEPLAADDPMTVLQVSAAKRLIDFMEVQRGPARHLRLQACTSLAALLDDLGDVLPELAAVVELKTICARVDPDSFDRVLQLAGTAQRALLAVEDPRATELCEAIAGIEATYFGETKAALDATTQRANAPGDAPARTARNTRNYNEKAVLDFIRRQYPEEEDLGIAESGFITGGYSKFTIGITLSNAKTLPDDIILRADAAATYGGASTVDEYRLTKTLYEHGMRVPKPLAVEETGEVFGSTFMLVEKKPGGSIGHMFKLPEPNQGICRELAEQLATLHNIPVETFDDRIDNANGRSSDKMRAWLDAGIAAWTPLNMPSPAFEAAFDWLRRNANINDQAPRALVHGDVHLANILVHDNQISTILDWEFAHIGNPAYDLGYFYDQAEALDSWDAFLDAYAAAGGRVPDQQQLDYAILFAATRLGVMVCQSRGEFTSGADPGLAGAIVIGDTMYEDSVMRINRVLERVL
jgi:aminoglycoside phosphotransferase (APT) family kinase protein